MAWLQAKLFPREGRTPAECYVFQTYLGAQFHLYLAVYFLLIATEKRSGIEALDGPRPPAMVIAAVFSFVTFLTLMVSFSKFYVSSELVIVPKRIVLILSGALMFVLGLRLLFFIHSVF